MNAAPSLTRERILAEPAGPRLNAWVAEHVMGWLAQVWRGATVYEWPGFRGAGTYPDRPRITEELPPWSTDIAAAWKVVEKYQERPHGSYMGLFPSAPPLACRVEICLPLGLQSQQLRDCAIHGRFFSVQAKTLPWAICRAVLLDAVAAEEQP